MGWAELEVDGLLIVAGEVEGDVVSFKWLASLLVDPFE